MSAERGCTRRNRHDKESHGRQVENFFVVSLVFIFIEGGKQGEDLVEQSCTTGCWIYQCGLHFRQGARSADGQRRGGCHGLYSASSALGD